MPAQQFEGPLSLLMAKHDSLKTVCAQLEKDFADEVKGGNVSQERVGYMQQTLANMKARIQKQATFFERWNMDLTEEELNSFTGGYNNEAWTPGHRNFGRHAR